MKRIIISALLTVAMSATVAGQTKARRPRPGPGTRSQAAGVEQQIKRLESEWFDAVARKDLPALDRIMAPDFISTNHDGRVVSKAQMLEAVSKGEGLAPDSIKSEDFLLRDYGSMAIVTGRSNYFRGGKMVGQVRHTQVWAKRQGRWQAVSWQGTPILDSPLTSPGREVTTASGLKYVDLVVGTGESPNPGQQVVVHYTGTLENGKKFDSSLERGEPFTFQIGVGKVIKGWDEGVMSMKVGGKRRLIIPSHLGYGERGAGGVIPPGATLIFEVELLGVR